jgi:hypothetical protein
MSIIKFTDDILFTGKVSRKGMTIKTSKTQTCDMTFNTKTGQICFASGAEDCVVPEADIAEFTALIS